MIIKFYCPAGHPIVVSARLRGEMVQCERCGRVAIVPEPDQGQAAAQESGIHGHTTAPGGKQTSTGDLPPAASAADAKPGRPLSLSGQTRRQHSPDGHVPGQQSATNPAADHHRAPPQPPPLSRAMAKHDQSWRQNVAERMVYRPDAGNISSARALAVLLAAIAIFGAIPAIRAVGIDLEFAPGWARASLMLAGLQLAFVAWMLATPDYSSAWVTMLLFAAVAALYALFAAMTLAADADRPLPLGLGDVRQTAGKWCVAVAGLTIIGTYAAGRVATRWERAADRATGNRQWQSRLG
jgi:hypothetical protein